MPSETCKVRLSCLKFSDQLLYPTNFASHFTAVDVIYKTSTWNDQGFVRCQRAERKIVPAPSVVRWCNYNTLKCNDWTSTPGKMEQQRACRCLSPHETTKMKEMSSPLLWTPEKKCTIMKEPHHWILPSATSNHSTYSIRTYLKIRITFNLPFFTFISHLVFSPWCFPTNWPK
jgi:hypothetical protein